MLRRRAPGYRVELLPYVGDNSNVVSWIKHRERRNRVARFSVRLLNRLETEYKFAAFACFISPRINNLRVELARTDMEDPTTRFRIGARRTWMCILPLIGS